MPNNPVTLTREELYDLVWSKPINQLAREFGFSDVGFAKVCKRLDVPRPDRGHWARLAAGHKVQRAPLQNAKQGTPASVELRPTPPDSEPQPNREIPVVHVSDSFRGAHAVTRELRDLLAGDPLGDPPMHVLRGRYTTVLRVSPDSSTRTLLILDALFRALGDRGHRIHFEHARHQHGRPQVTLQVVVAEESIDIALIEKSGQRPHTLTEEEKKHKALHGYSWAPKYDRFTTGRLSLEVGEHHFRDGKRQQVEERLGHAVIAAEDHAEAMKVRRSDDEQEARRQNVERQRLEMERRREEHIRALGNDLLQMTNRWVQAGNVNAFLDAYEERLGECERSDGVVRWLEWAREFACKLDPLVRIEGIAKKFDGHSF